jgi:hypothetical protein
MLHHKSHREDQISANSVHLVQIHQHSAKWIPSSNLTTKKTNKQSSTVSQVCSLNPAIKFCLANDQFHTHFVKYRIERATVMKSDISNLVCKAHEASKVYIPDNAQLVLIIGIAVPHTHSYS